MEPPPPIHTVHTTIDEDLRSFLDGSFQEPEDRVSRKGVPDNRVRSHEPRSSTQIWKTVKPIIERQAKLRRKAAIFKYLPIDIEKDEIRLLRIRPGKPVDDVECDLCVKSLAKVKGTYEALSYCWGNKGPEEVISIYQMESKEAGQSLMQPKVEFPVRSNLLQALRHLRREDKGVIIWIDAICINQRIIPAAINEKNRQLSMMSDIYNSAKNVCIWLGAANDVNASALKFVNTITNFQMLDRRLEKTDHVAGEEWRHLVETLKEKQWFGRRWIIQEIASARNASVHCGNHVVHWDDLSDAISLLLENHEILKQRFNLDAFSEVPALSAAQLVKALTIVCRKSSTGEISERLLDLETLVCTFQQFQAGFPQDVIHSVRALAKDATHKDDKDEFAIGAEHGKSTRDLFIAFVQRCIRKSGSVDIICRHWAPPVADSAGERIRLPSWISELSNGPFGLPGESHERQNGENFVAFSPHDIRPRYRASQGWGRSDLQSPRRARAPEPLAVPKSSNTEHNRWSTGNLTDANLTDSPVPSPMLEKGNPYQQSLIRDELVNRPPPLATLLETPSVKNSVDGNELDSRLLKRRANEDNSVNPVNAESTRNEHKTPKYEYPFRHRRANTISNPQAPSKAKEFLDIWADAAMFPGRLRAQPVRQDSKSKQDSYVQDDQEHNQDLLGRLDVTGLILGTVSDSSDLMRDGIIPGDWLGKLGWNQRSSDNNVPDVLWRTLVADRNPDGGNPPGWYRRACLHCLKDTRLVNSRGDLNSHRMDKVSESMTSMYLKRVSSVIWRRRIIELSSDGSPDTRLYGLAPEQTRDGDIVCILVGCSVPVVLKRVLDPVPLPHEGTVGIFELVGEAYIHGKMDGEAVEDVKAADELKKTFTLQ